MTCMPPTLALAIIRMLDANGSNSVNTAAGDIAIDGEQYVRNYKCNANNNADFGVSNKDK
jgi:hypothetical protein